MKKYRTFPSEFKRELIARIDNGEITVSEAAREHNLAPSLVDLWRKKIHEGTFQDKPTPREKQLEKEGLSPAEVMATFEESSRSGSDHALG